MCCVAHNQSKVLCVSNISLQGLGQNENLENVVGQIYLFVVMIKSGGRRHLRLFKVYVNGIENSEKSKYQNREGFNNY